MKQTISYKDIPEAEAVKKAVADVKFYVGGTRRFNKIKKELTSYINQCSDMGKPATWQMVNFMFGMTGIEGYPVTACIIDWGLKDKVVEEK